VKVYFKSLSITRIGPGQLTGDSRQVPQVSNHPSRNVHRLNTTLTLPGYGHKIELPTSLSKELSLGNKSVVRKKTRKVLEVRTATTDNMNLETHVPISTRTSTGCHSTFCFFLCCYVLVMHSLAFESLSLRSFEQQDLVLVRCFRNGRRVKDTTIIALTTTALRTVFCYSAIYPKFFHYYVSASSRVRHVIGSSLGIVFTNCSCTNQLLFLNKDFFLSISIVYMVENIVGQFRLLVCGKFFASSPFLHVTAGSKCRDLGFMFPASRYPFPSSSFLSIQITSDTEMALSFTP
jgi:hypothetical protein